MMEQPETRREPIDGPHGNTTDLVFWPGTLRKPTAAGSRYSIIDSPHGTFGLHIFSAQGRPT